MNPEIQQSPQNSVTRYITGGIARWATYLAVAAAAAHVLTYLVVAILRIRYPFELEWMEGSMVDHVARVAGGLPLYVGPSLDFIPAPYTPLYYYVSALVVKFTGLGFFPLRLVSLVSSLACFAVIFFVVRRETGRLSAAVIAAGLFAATYEITGTFFDLARVDAFAMFLLLLGAAIIYGAESPLRLASAAIVLSLAYFAKQSVLPAIALLTLYSFYSARLRSVWFVGPLILLIGVGSLWMNEATDGWFRYYTLDISLKHPATYSPVTDFWQRNLKKHVPILCYCSVLSLVIAFKGAKRRSFWYMICLLVGFAAVSFLGKSSIFGYINNMLPVYGALAICTGFLLGALSRVSFLEKHKEILAGVLAIALVHQFSQLRYKPARMIPSEEMRIEGKRFVLELSKIPGNLYLPCHGYLATLAGKHALSHQQAWVDVASADSSAGRKLNDELAQRLSKKEFGLIVFDTLRQSPELGKYYTLAANPLGDSVIYHPWMGGERFRPRYWYVPDSEQIAPHSP
jgi:hypothetical protein